VIDRRTFIGAVAGAFLTAPLAVEAQQLAKLARIGYLGTGSPAEIAPSLEAFRQGLRELGYVEGRNIAFEYRWAEGRMERLSAFAVEFVGLKSDVIVASSSPAALAAKDATQTIPIVFVTAGDPVDSGLVASIARPGGNVTGFSLLAPEIVARQLQLLKEAVPKASRVVVLANPTNRNTALLVKETEDGAHSLGVGVQFVGVRSADALDDALSSVTKERPDALLVLFDPMLFTHRTRIAEFANSRRLPTMYPHREYAETGGLMSYGASIPDLSRRAATYVDKILKGTKPADLPVQQPTKFELVINLKTAKALGVTIPQSLLVRADEVIQ
jgi:putative ABC transport system substrate-binding protein